MASETISGPTAVPAVQKPRPKVQRGEVWTCDLNPQTHKAEPAKHNRPVLVLQVNELNLNKHHHSVIIVPGTTDADEFDPAAAFPLRVQVKPQEQLLEVTDFLCASVRAVGIHRLTTKLATLSPNTVRQISSAVSQLIGASPFTAPP